MNGRTTVHGLAVDDSLLTLINHAALPGTGLETDAFWTGFAQIINDLTPATEHYSPIGKNWNTPSTTGTARELGSPMIRRPIAIFFPRSVTSFPREQTLR